MKKFEILLILLTLLSISLGGCTSKSPDQQPLPGTLPTKQMATSAPEWTNKGNELSSQGRNQEALEAFDTALSLDPNYSPAWNGKGNALCNLGRNQEALDAFNIALSMNADFSSAWHGKGNALFNLGKPQEALDAYNKALSLDINNQWAWFGKGNVLFSLGKYQEALEAYDRGLSIDADNSPVWASKGHALLQLGRTQEAIQAFDRALSIDPNNQRAKAGKSSALSGSTIPQIPPQPSPQIPPQPIPSPSQPVEDATLGQVKSGTLQHDETWSGQVYIPDTIWVPNGVTLTIEPGTIIKFKHARDYRDLHRGTLIIHGGTLQAIGTPTEPIWFTSDAEKPINGDWEGIAIENSNRENICKYCIVEYAFIGIRFWTASGTVANSIVRWINAEGIYMERSHVAVENSLFYGTGYDGIAMEQFNDVIIRNNKFFNNQGAGIHGEATKAILENNIVRNSRTGITFDDISEITLRNNLVENIRAEGIHLYFNSIGNLVSNKVRNNGVGINSYSSSLTISNSDICGNSRNLVLFTMQQVDVRHNWWGSTDSATIKGKIESDIDVAIEPFLNEEAVSIPEPVYDYQDVKKTELSYIPGDPQDQYPYIYADTDETRKVVKKICGAAEGFGESAFGWSLAWDGKYLWRSRHAGGGELIKIDPETCAVVADFGNVGVAQDRGMAYDGKSLWINDFTQKRVFEIDPITGKVISSFNIPEMGSGSSGIAWDGEFLYLVDWLKRSQVGAPLYKVDRQGNLIDTLQLEKEGGASITFDGQYFWISPCRKGICKYDKKGKLVGEIYAAAFGGEAIAHDGKYLWVLHRTQEQWNDPKLYKIEVVNDQILLSK